jgi:predicted RNA-binding protein with RPS1 domain
MSPHAYGNMNLSEGIMSEQRREPQSEEYRNFEELARKLLAVPKKEVEKKKAAHQKKKRGKRSSSSR